MKLLSNLYSGPAAILAKARRDRDALKDAVASDHEDRVRDELFDFSVTAYHVLDWVKANHPNLEREVYALLNSTPSLQACRDIANAHKHAALDLASRAYRTFPPVVEALDYSLGPTATVSAFSGSDFDVKRPSTVEAPLQQYLKASLATGHRLRIERMTDEAIAAWERFFQEHDLT
jgi:hypothetical protein